MAYDAKILKDSLSPQGVRLTTIEVTFPRIVLAEFNTHRTFSRNSASSRAIPVEKMLKKVKEDPFIPIYWGVNQKGMQAEHEFAEHEKEGLRLQWLRARDQAIFAAESLLQTGVHKQITNRLLEPWLWHTVICTATEWDNFWGLRRHKDAQPEIRKAAELMHEVYVASTPKAIAYDDWHLPLVEDDEAFDLEVEGFDVRKVSAGRCARVSYLTHDGKRDPQADIDLSDRLVQSGHMSPLEHVARPMSIDDAKNVLLKQITTHRSLSDVDPKNVFCGNFRGWISHRKLIPGEAVFMST